MGSLDEQEIEGQLKREGASGPRLTPDLIDATIVEARYHHFTGTTLTVCCLILKNGFCVVGESAAADPVNFNPRIGRELANIDARRKIWALEGYLLRESLHRAPRGKPNVSQAFGETDRRPTQEILDGVVVNAIPTSANPLAQKWGDLSSDRQQRVINEREAELIALKHNQKPSQTFGGPQSSEYRQDVEGS